MDSAVALVGYHGMKPREAGLQKHWLQGRVSLEMKEALVGRTSSRGA